MDTISRKSYKNKHQIVHVNYVSLQTWKKVVHSVLYLESYSMQPFQIDYFHLEIYI